MEWVGGPKNREWIYDIDNCGRTQAKGQVVEKRGSENGGKRSSVHCLRKDSHVSGMWCHCEPPGTGKPFQSNQLNQTDNEFYQPLPVFHDLSLCVILWAIFYPSNMNLRLLRVRSLVPISYSSLTGIANLDVGELFIWSSDGDNNFRMISRLKFEENSSNLKQEPKHSSGEDYFNILLSLSFY